MIDAVEALGDVGVQDHLWFGLYGVHDLFYRIVAAPSRTEPIAVRFEYGFSFGLYRYLHKGLEGPIVHGGYAEWAHLFRARLGYPYASHGFGLSSDF